ncbi:hypothetical protein HO133_007422 [Letharia lupina]|uniref:Xylanolytic transcriptional activator regulatory domain-containing protein n=1 Tax=Letharia lupina TaxID=560253 RepID=A0A8H6KYT6_9LECA|nr:uncharacterized protein HO133_007422 [Letharia lupina]KAF6229306.1 hypothetical protein HO133_007422 [Letharia lupina]
MAPPTREVASHAPVQQFAMQHFDAFSDSKEVSPMKSPINLRHHPYSQNNTEVRHQHRRSLDLGAVGDKFGLSCEYMRERKKRGKTSRKDAAQQDPAANAHSPREYSSEGPSPTQTQNGHEFQSAGSQAPPADGGPRFSGSQSGSMSAVRPERSAIVDGPYQLTRNDGLAQNQEQGSGNLSYPQSSIRQGTGASPTAMSLNGFSLGHDYDRPGIRGVTPLTGPQSNGLSMSQMQPQMPSQQSFQGFGENAYPPISPPSLQAPSPGFRFGATGESPLAGFFGTSPIVGSPGWLNLPSPSNYQNHHRRLNSIHTLRFPVLKPLLPYIESIIPVSLACDLLELYFTSSSTTHTHPVSPYILGYVFRKQSFLDGNRPRVCSPALLSSMLWLAAQTSDSPFLTSPPSARGRVCQKLLDITIALLKPLIHGPPAGDVAATNGMSSVINGVALGGLGVAMTGGDQLTADGGAIGLLDNVATYIHLAVIVSASEYKAASMRWWNAAWTLARELKLGRELPGAVESDNPRGDDLSADGIADGTSPEQATVRASMKESLAASLPGVPNEEGREERRRVWWLLYTVDRHLALCYNRPLFLLDVECEGLLQPLNDGDFQAGNFYSSDPTLSPSSQPYRTRGPNFLCTGHSIFGYFTPLMAILGYIVELNQARNHPRFGQSSRHVGEWDDRAAEITSQLEAYGHSLKEFEARHIDESNILDRAGADTCAPINSVHPGNSRITDAIIQTRIVVAYGSHIMHVLHILITGKWDPINLLDDKDLWISTPSFSSAIMHAVAAANAISNVLEYDPDLSFMPWFFGISLLQGGFLLLLMADKLAGQADPNVVRACENIVKAHEACIVTLNTEYQVSTAIDLELLHQA